MTLFIAIIVMCIALILAVIAAWNQSSPGLFVTMMIPSGFVWMWHSFNTSVAGAVFLWFAAACFAIIGIYLWYRPAATDNTADNLFAVFGISALVTSILFAAIAPSAMDAVKDISFFGDSSEEESVDDIVVETESDDDVVETDLADEEEQSQAIELSEANFQEIKNFLIEDGSFVTQEQFAAALRVITLLDEQVLADDDRRKEIQAEMQEILGEFDDIESLSNWLESILESQPINVRDVLSEEIGSYLSGYDERPTNNPITAKTDDGHEFGTAICSEVNRDGRQGEQLVIHLAEYKPANKVVQECYDLLVNQRVCADAFMLANLARQLDFGSGSAVKYGKKLADDPELKAKMCTAIKDSHNAAVKRYNDAKGEGVVAPRGFMCFYKLYVQAEYFDANREEILFGEPRFALCEEEINLFAAFVNNKTDEIVTLYFRIHCGGQGTKLAEAPPEEEEEEPVRLVQPPVQPAPEPGEFNYHFWCDESNNPYQTRLTINVDRGSADFATINNDRYSLSDEASNSYRKWQSDGDKQVAVRIVMHWNNGTSTSLQKTTPGNCVFTPDPKPGSFVVDVWCDYTVDPAKHRLTIRVSKGAVQRVFIDGTRFAFNDSASNSYKTFGIDGFNPLNVNVKIDWKNGTSSSKRARKAGDCVHAQPEPEPDPTFDAWVNCNWNVRPAVYAVGANVTSGKIDYFTADGKDLNHPFPGNEARRIEVKGHFGNGQTVIRHVNVDGRCVHAQQEPEPEVTATFDAWADCNYNVRPAIYAVKTKVTSGSIDYFTANGMDLNHPFPGNEAKQIEVVGHYGNGKTAVRHVAVNGRCVHAQPEPAPPTTQPPTPPTTQPPAPPTTPKPGGKDSDKLPPSDPAQESDDQASESPPASNQPEEGEQPGSTPGERDGGRVEGPPPAV